MIPALPDDVLARLSALTTAQLGLRFPPDRWSELARGVASAALELGIPDLEGWAETLAAGKYAPEHWSAIANHLTISETYFFRQRDGFDVLEKAILPARLARRRSEGRSLRIWSAGCASGEEPYSIAILLRQKFPEVTAHSIVITATDINSRVLARASAGVYTDWSFRDAPEWLRDFYFNRKGANRWELAPEIRAMVRFVELNLASPIYPAAFGERADYDVIFCRNVLMYFSGEWQEKIIRRFHAALAPEGWLIVGPCDITAAQAAALHLSAEAPGLYQKTDRPPVARHTPAETIEAMPDPADLPWTFTPSISEASGIPFAEPKLPEEPAPAEPTAQSGEVGEPFAEIQAQADRGELSQALAACERALALAPLNPNLHYLRGCILQEQQRFDESVQAFRRVVFLDPNAIMAEFGLAALAERAGRREEARRHFSAVLQLLAARNQGEPVPRGDGLTVGRLRDVVAKALTDDAA